MSRPYSLDLRDRVVAAVEKEGLSRHQAAARFGVAVSTAVHWVRRYRSTGNVAPSKIGGYKPRTLRGEHAEWLIARCREKDFTISQLVEELQMTRGLKVDRHSVWEFLHAEGLSFKKKSVRAREQDRPDVARRREQWRTYQGRIDPRRLVFIDETWAKTNMSPLRGWGPRGARLKAKAPFGRWETMTFIAALRCDRIDAPCLFDGPINGEAFLAYVQTFLVPTLKEGDVVIMDNLGSHRGKAVRKAIRQAGARLLFLPKYSPDLNPIEQFFSKLKHWLRKAQRRSQDDVCNAIAIFIYNATSN
ncbi:MAG: IS630 family transposase, partial [Candidatus Binataceae bacterium]